MRRSHALIFLAAAGCFHATPTRLRQHQPGGGGLSNIDDFAKILSQAKANSPGNGSSSDFFNGRFEGGSATMDPSMLQNMHRTLNQSLTPEMQDSMRAMMEGLKRGDGIPQMGVMAFGVGENERGKKVARGAKLTFDPNTGRVSKDFVESQLEEDDPMLPKETVGDYHTEGAIEVEFEEDSRRRVPTAAKPISEADVVLEGPSASSRRSGSNTRK
ncbi:uncharacterized protein Tco025E_02433 [Trypanosoma conorhini]|uniref:Uncharacterized protein n=1 Tax=Trypanosoma conorhini TaxID=83891 RepID=A0A422Q3Y3_9TRYP|nr:uncharacterized protein Tco025E_02433 [Trypanosoma conorhini]RNF24674.1 hypothetical protein Tco025E_02433 [Trypanosoma conorhini]